MSFGVDADETVEMAIGYKKWREGGGAKGGEVKKNE